MDKNTRKDVSNHQISEHTLLLFQLNMDANDFFFCKLYINAIPYNITLRHTYERTKNNGLNEKK